MTDYTPVNSNGTIPFSLTASAAITGGQLVAPSGNGTVAPAGAGGFAIGVAAQDVGNGARVPIWPISTVLHETTNANAGAATAGNAVIPAAAGATDISATPATPAAAGTLLGFVTTGAAAGGKMRWIGRG